jgi:hypothetical protein
MDEKDKLRAKISTRRRAGNVGFGPKMIGD